VAGTIASSSLGSPTMAALRWRSCANLESFKFHEPCAAPTGLGTPRENDPTAALGLFMRNGESVGNAAKCGHFFQSHFVVFRHFVVSAKASKMRSNPHPGYVSHVWPAKLMNNPGAAVGYVVSSLTGLERGVACCFLPGGTELPWIALFPPRGSGMMMDASLQMFLRRLSGLISSDEKRVADFF
jgi:hypothetical protein